MKCSSFGCRVCEVVMSGRSEVVGRPRGGLEWKLRGIVEIVMKEFVEEN